MLRYFFLGVFCLLTPATAQPIPRLVKDVNASPSQYGGIAGTAIALNDKLIFLQYDLTHGYELWVADASGSEPRLLKDVNPGSGDGEISLIGIHQGCLYFSAGAIYSTKALWKTDGTEIGTVSVGTLPGLMTPPTRIGDSASLGNGFFFTDVGGHLFAGNLYRIDDPSTGLVVLNPLQSMPFFGRQFRDPRNLMTFNGSLYFISSENQLWKSDGTPDGCSEVVTLGSPLCMVISSAICQDSLYFTVWDTENDQKSLWRSDGTASGTVLVKDLGHQGRQADFLTAAGSNLFFWGWDLQHGIELWTSDGTPAGTGLLSDLRAGVESSDPSGFTVVGGKLFFRATTGLGTELWTSDGTAAGTVLVKDLAPGAPGSNPGDLTAGDQMLYFTADDGISGHELWKTDGTTAGTVRVKDINPGAGSSIPHNLVMVGSVLYFGTVDSGRTLIWKSNGTAEGTIPLERTSPGTVSGVWMEYYDKILTLGDTCFFRGNDGTHGYELWKSDGTEAGTKMVKDIFPEGSESQINLKLAIGNRLYFRASQGPDPGGYWVTDGTEEGTHPIGNHYPGEMSSDQDVVELNGVLYYLGGDTYAEGDLWRSDGTPAGTYQLKDIVTGDNIGRPAHFTIYRGEVYFSANGGYPAGEELWKTDGTEAGTVLVKDLRGGNGSSSPRDLKVVGDRLFFTASGSGVTRGLWISDGTSQGTSMLADLGVAASGSDLCRMTAEAGGLRFALDRSGHTEYWKSDGTAAGTTKLLELPPELDSSRNPVRDRLWVWKGGTAYFVATDTPSGQELWKTDGTPAGTGIVAAIRSGEADPAIRDLLVVGRFIYFTADDGIHGRELWKSDGTPMGTVLVHDLTGGDSGGSDPLLLTLVGTELFFKATTEVSGSELFALDVTDDIHLSFDQWVVDGGWSGDEALPGATPFQDGMPNLLKYAFNLSATAPDRRMLIPGTGSAGIPAFNLERSESAHHFSVEFLRRKKSGLVYTPKYSTTLQTGSFSNMTGPVIVTQLDAEWERVVVRQPVDPTTPSCFGVVEVSQP